MTVPSITASPGAGTIGQASGDSDAEGTLDASVLVKQLAPDQLALFEPLSAIMLLNIEEEHWRGVVGRVSAGTTTPEDERLGDVMNHETYHFAQAAASGYMFRQQQTACRVLNAAPPYFHPREDPANAEMVARAREAAGDDPDAMARVERVLALASAVELFDGLRARAPPGDHSLAGPLLPDFFAHVAERRAAEAAVNAHGLSILGLLEGSAVIAASLLGSDPDNAADHVRDEVATLPPVYAELFAFSRVHAGDRAIEAALPATAVALCYARPHDAYCALLPMVASAPAGEARTRGRALFEAPPAIEAAGSWLGDAVAQRDADDSYRVYDPFHEMLRSNQSGVDAYELLADPRALLGTNRAPLALMTRSNWHGPSDRDELGARVYLMSMVLKVQSRLRAERDLYRDLAEWGRGVIGRLFEDTGR